VSSCCSWFHWAILASSGDLVGQARVLLGAAPEPPARLPPAPRQDPATATALPWGGLTALEPEAAGAWRARGTRFRSGAGEGRAVPVPPRGWGSCHVHRSVPTTPQSSRAPRGTSPGPASLRSCSRAPGPVPLQQTPELAAAAPAPGAPGPAPARASRLGSAGRAGAAAIAHGQAWAKGRWNRRPKLLP